MRLPAFRPFSLVLTLALVTACNGDSKDTTDTGEVGAVDADGDGFFEEVDCDDNDASIYPGADDTPYDGVDSNCDESDDFDLDGDGYAGAADDSGEDCDDSDGSINPGADETCDGVDNNCDGSIDDDTSVDATAWYTDTDGDGFGDDATATTACDQPSGTVEDNTDCDDTSETIHPGADELCDGVDSDCDGSVNEDDALDASTWYADADQDSFGDPNTTTTACDQPTGHVADNTDCDDTLGTIRPGADEYCDGVDHDCDGDVLEDDSLDAVDWYIDDDSDGYGDSSTSVASCTAPTNYVADGTDCDDTDSTINPGSFEICNGGVDDDCDATTVEEDRVSSLDSSGVWTDNSAYFGTSASTATAISISGGTHYFCPGTYYGVIDILSSASLVSSSQDASDTILDGIGAGDVVRVYADGIDATIQDLTIQNGSGATVSSTTYGGGIFCASAANTSSVSLDGAVIQDNSADYGGGIYAEGCELDTAYTVIQNNDAEYGGGVHIYDADATFSFSDISNNSAEKGGGFRGVNLSLTGSVMSIELEDSWVEENTAESSGAGGYVYAYGGNVEMNCTGSSTDSAGFLSNEVTDGEGSALTIDALVADSVVNSTLCSWGEFGSTDNNDGEDILTEDSGNLYVYGDNASFACTEDTCSPAHQVDHLGEDSTTNWAQTETFIGNIYQATSTTVLEHFSQALDPDQVCDVDFGVYSSSNSNGPWTTEGEVTSTVPGGPAWMDSGTMNVTMTQGLYYLIGIHYVPANCGGTVWRYHELNNSDDASFGTYTSHWYEWGLSGWTGPDANTASGSSTYTQRVYTLQ